jgi:hypothetical protein
VGERVERAALPKEEPRAFRLDDFFYGDATRHQEPARSPARRHPFFSFRFARALTHDA